LAQGLLRFGDAVFSCGRQQGVYVIGHQAIGMDGTPVLVSLLLQPAYIHLIITVFKEDGLAVIAALNDMGRNARQIESGFSGHANVLVQMVN